MDPDTVTAASAAGDGLELRVTESTWTKLMAHLLPGDGDEHAAVLLCGTARSNRGTRLLVREVVLAQDGIDYVPGTRGYRHLRGEFVTHQVRRAKRLGLAYVAVHNHRGTDHVAFSTADLASHARAYPTLLKVTGQTVGALVCASSVVAGDIWHLNGDRDAVDRTVVIGRRRTVLTPAPDHTDPSIAARYDRQALLYGSIGQAILATTKVVVVGAGGVGMLLVEYLARLGVGHIVVIDPDRVDPTNLPRLPGATRWDAMEYLDRDGMPQVVRRLARRFARHKVDVAKRLANRANPRVTIAAITGDIADDAAARQALDADYMFLAADTMLARDVVNQIAYQYLIPTLQVGSKITLDRATGQVTDVFAAVRHLGTAPGCLRCNGLVDTGRLAEEALGDPEQAINQRYIDDGDVRAPSVITLNALGSGFAANDFMLHTVGLPSSEPAYRLLRNAPRGATGRHITVIEPNADPACHVCSHADTSALARGDSSDLPTRI